MKFGSTRGAAMVTLDEALISGIATDGGLFLPDALPEFDGGDFEGAESIIDVARVLLSPFFEGSTLAGQLDGILDETFTFPLPLTELPVTGGGARLLELFHGPTAAFKDVGAAFLAACFSRLQPAGARPLTILVATSGDTGGAVAAAFDGRDGIRVAVLFPEGRVSERQAQQLTCWSNNVLSLAVRGSFDDCQALVKKAMADPDLRLRHRFSSANSINIGRLLPQCTYYAQSSLEHYRATGRKPSYVVPTGNLGNALAAMLTRRMGLPVDEIVLATNANRVIVDYLDDGEWRPRPSIETLATAMDVGDPSNMERLRALFGDVDSLRGTLRACSVTDEQIRRQIREDYRDFGFAVCPHTATASAVWRKLRQDGKENRDWIVVATAHPAKFEQIVEPLIGAAVPVPDALRRILERPSRFIRIDAELTALAAALVRLDEAAAAGDK